MELLLAYCARKLDADGMAAVEQHTRGCPACLKFVGGQRAVWEALDSWEAVPVSPDFDRRLYARIEQEVSWWSRLVPLMWRQGLPVAAAAGLVLVAAVLLERPAGVPVFRAPVSAQVDVVGPDQAEHALEEMEMMRELNRLVVSEAAEAPKM
jgi:hypothetical protein